MKVVNLVKRIFFHTLGANEDFFSFIALVFRQKKAGNHPG